MNTPLQDAIDRAAPAPGTRTQTNDQHRGGSAHGLGHAKQAAPSRVSVTKRDGSREPFDADRINRALERATEGLDNAVGLTVQIASELELTLFDGITTAAARRGRHPGRAPERQGRPRVRHRRRPPAAQDHLQARARRLRDRRRARRAARRPLPRPTSSAASSRSCSTRASPSCSTSTASPTHLDPSHDELLKYIGVVTLNNRYGIKARNGEPARGAAVLLDAHRDGPLAQRGRPHQRTRSAFYEKMSQPRVPRRRLHARQRRHRVPAALQLLRHGDAGRHRAHRQERARRHVAHQGHRRHRPLGHQAARAGLADPLEQHHLDRPDPVHAHHRLGAARGQPRRQEVRRPVLLHGELAPRLPGVPRPAPELRRPVPPHPHRQHRGVDQRRVHEARAERRGLVPVRPARGRRPQRALRQGVLGALRRTTSPRPRPAACACSRRSARASSSRRS